MMSTAMFFTTAIFVLIIGSFYPDWHWFPQTPMEAALEGICVIMMFASALMLKMEELARKLDARK